MPDVAVENHLMLDLETLDVTPSSIVLEIGAVAFDPYGALLEDITENTKNTFFRSIELDSCLKLGLGMSQSTFHFWLEQDEQSRYRIIKHPKVHIGTAAEALRKFCQDHTVTKVWSHGATMDIAIMTEVYRRLHKEVPWSYRDVRDTRTLYGMIDWEESDAMKSKWEWLMRRPVKHHPVHDAWAQARAVQYCLAGEDDGSTDPPQDPAGAGPLAG